MSRKWQRAKRWDDEHLAAPMLRPVKWLLRALSSIALSVVLLTLVALYGVVASVPIGMLAQIPVWLVILATGAGVIGLIVAAVVVPARAIIPERMRGLRFAATVLLGVGAAAVASRLFVVDLLPVVRYDPGTGSGLRLLGGLADEYASTTIRRLPAFEMTELEFYSWWPMRLLLVLFVVNMVTATVRRIEFTFRNLGVLTVHSGIVLLALGSAFYQALKVEGDTLLVAGPADQTGSITAGPLQNGFYDINQTALWVSQRADFAGRPTWEQRFLRGVPRYNDYGLPGPGGEPGRTLDRPVPAGGGRLVDPDIRFRVVGYAEYARLEPSLVVYDSERLAAERVAGPLRPFRAVELRTRLPDDFEDPDDVDPEAEAANPARAAFRFELLPTVPARRVSDNDVIGIEYAIGMDETRWRDLLTPAPVGAPGLLAVEVPRADGDPVRAALPATPGLEAEVAGWRLLVEQILPEPPFPIITDGYRGGSSAVAIVGVTPPETADDPTPFQRYAYHRYPEIDQDILALPADETGRPGRRDATPAIRVGFVDASHLQVYFNERPDGSVDVLIRGARGGEAETIDLRRLAPGERDIADVVPLVDLRVADRAPHTADLERPVPVPQADRRADLVGTHTEAALAVEVSLPGGAGVAPWTETVWLPFVKYLSAREGLERAITLPDGRELTLVFGRRRHTFADFRIRLEDFEMIAYDHRGAPRDYQSRVLVSPAPQRPDEPAPGFEAYERTVRLNAPLRAPFVWSDERPVPINAAMKLVSGFNPRQYKLSQAGWDQQGWEETQALADQGLLAGPSVRFTILQVGNNPGILVIALGGVMVGLGTPWAFYVKPWLVRRERARLASAAAASNATGRAAAGRDEPANDQQTPAERARPAAATQGA